MTVNVELEKLYLEDREARLKNSFIEKNFKKRFQNIKKILPLIDENEIWNCHYLAYFFHHSGKKSDYELAYNYAKKAVEMGSNVTKWLLAATLDRYLVSQGKLQKFGTQFKKKGNKWERLPVDGSITDEERLKHGVKKLKDIPKLFREKYHKTQ